MLEFLEVVELERAWDYYNTRRRRKIRLIVGGVSAVIIAALAGFAVVYSFNLGRSEISAQNAAATASAKEKLERAQVEQLKKKELARLAAKKATEASAPAAATQNPAAAEPATAAAEKPATAAKPVAQRPLLPISQGLENIANKFMDLASSKASSKKAPPQMQVLIDREPLAAAAKPAAVKPAKPAPAKPAKPAAQKPAQRPAPKIIKAPAKEVNVKAAIAKKPATTAPAAQKPAAQKTNIAFLKQQFEKTRSPNFAVDIAEIYLAQKDLQNAQTWALRANSMDPSNERSWLVFARIKTASGQKDAAVRVLKTYLRKNASSKTAAKMLEELENAQKSGGKN